MPHQVIGRARKHPSLTPLFIHGAGGPGAALDVTCLALFNPDVSWDRKNNLEPWNPLGPTELGDCELEQTEERRPRLLMKRSAAPLLRRKVSQKLFTRFPT
uniref:Cytochrome c oxidase subunit NDUFA4 n=1 Tax=Oryctolagus cuniculus TaxID=9986 RepID=A0A5F9CEB0_RABIT